MSPPRRQPSHHRSSSSAGPQAGPDVCRLSPQLQRWWLVVLAIAIGVRVVYWLDYRSSPLFDTAAGPDVKEYHNWALQILAGQWVWPRVPLHGPGYAYLLAFLYAITSQSLAAVRAIQLLLGLLGWLAVSLAVRQRFGAVAAVGTAFIWACYVPLVYYEAELFSESLTCLLHALVLAVLITAPAPVNRGRCAVVGLLLGLSIITHSTAMALTFLMAAWLAWDAWRGRQQQKLSWLNPLITVALAGLVVLPVAIHNSKLAGNFVLVQRHDGLNFYIGNNPQADGTPNVRFGPDWDRLILLPWQAAGVREEAERRSFYFAKSFEFIRESPTKWLALLARKFALALTAQEVTSSAPMAALRPDIFLLRLPHVSFGLLLALAAVGLRGGVAKMGPVLMLLLAFLATQTLFVAAGRYRAPMLPALFILAGVGLQHLILVWQQPDRPELIRSFALAVAALACAWLPVVPANNEDAAEAALARATAYWTKQDWAAVVAELEPAVAQRPDHVPSQIYLGQALYRLGQLDEALPHYEQAVACEPDDPWALATLAYALAEQGDRIAALTLFQRALKFNPEDGNARFGLAQQLASLDRWQPAAEHYRHFVSRHPDHVDARLRLFEVLSRQGLHEEAAQCLQAGLLRLPEHVEFYVRLARLRSASNGDARQPAAALAWARRAAKLIDIQSVVRQLQRRQRDLHPLAAEVLDVLAMAYATNESFDLATKTAALALRAAELTEQPALQQQITERLELYRQQQPYRE